jgi:hypothetical protein
MLKLIVKLKFDDNNENNIVKNTTNTINWVECYSNEIAIILEMFSKLNKIVKNLYNKIEGLINDGKIKYESSERCPDNMAIVNKALFLGMESIIKILTSREEIYINIINDEKKLNNVLNIIKEIMQSALKLDYNLSLFSKEVFSLREILLIIDCYISNKKLTSDNIKALINYYSDGADYINEDNEKEIITHFNKLHETFKGINKDKMSLIFINEYNKINNKKFREELLSIILKNDEYIYNSNILFKTIISIKTTPAEMLKVKSNLLNINMDNEKHLYDLLNKCNNEYFEQMTLNIFDFSILKFFEEISNLKKPEDFKPKKREPYKTHFKRYYESISNNSLNETYIIFDTPLKIFKECVDELDKIINNNDQEKNLYKLFAISYIKIYLQKFVTFNYEKNAYIGDIKDIITAILGTSTNNIFRKVLKIYIFKVYYNLMKKDWNEIYNYNFPYYGIEFVDIIAEGNEDSYIVKEIINENVNPTDERFKKFPFLKYFIYTKYKTREIFIKELREDYKNEYPLLYKYLSEEKGDVKKMDCLSNVNEFSNYMIDSYSFNISREEAKNKIIETENIFTNSGLKRKYDSFITSWNKIKSKCIKFKYHPVMNEKTLNQSDKLAYFLNDTNEVDFGMYIAAAYQNFINWQNEFLQYIIDNGKNKKNLVFYIDELKKQVPVYEANSNQILSFNCFSSSIYEDFDELINTFSKRNIYNNGTINYSEYNTFKYDISSIEEELAKLLLAGKCLFEKENLKLVKYLGEDFNGKSDILDRFYKKYSQIELEKEEKEKIVSILKNENNNNLKQFLGGIELIIFYLSNNIDKEERAISDILNNPPDYLMIEDTCFRFFNDENGKIFNIKQLISIFYFSEHLYFKESYKKLQDMYKEEIPEEIIEKIELIKKEENNIIPIKELAAAVRRFISRYLLDKRQKEIDPTKMLLPYLCKTELWDQKIGKIENLEELIANRLEKLKITVGQSYNLYEKIKEKDEEEISTYLEEDEKEEEEEQIIKVNQIKTGRKIRV